jgi:hypothetical protein
MSKLKEHQCDWVEAYVLGGLTEAEGQQFVTHVQSCPECAVQVLELIQIIDLLPLATPIVEVPVGMKHRILNKVLKEGALLPPPPPQTNSSDTKPTVPVTMEANVDVYSREIEIPVVNASPSNRGVIYRTIMTVGLCAAVIVFSIYSAQLRRDVQDLKLAISLAAQPVTALKVNQAVTLSPAAKDIVAQGLAAITIDNKGTHLIVQAQKLPELKGNQAFQVWLLKNNKPVNAGTFLSQQGNGALYYTFEPKGYDTIAITLEPDALGKQQPRGQIILAAPIKAEG